MATAAQSITGMNDPNATAVKPAEPQSTPTQADPSPGGSDTQSTASITVQLQGGLDTIFQGRRSLSVRLPYTPGTPPTALHLIRHLAQTYLAGVPASQRALFTTADGMALRPGILVLVDEVDWELEGGEEALVGREVGGAREVVFVSTLHGG